MKYIFNDLKNNDWVTEWLICKPVPSQKNTYITKLMCIE